MDSPILEKVKLGESPPRFGIQLRCVFMFEETLLTNLSGVGEVVKSIPKESRASQPFNPSRRDESIYNSWGVIDANLGGLRPYKYEPMNIAREIMRAVVSTVDVRRSTGNPRWDIIDTSWRITNDINASGASPELLKSCLQQTAAVENWDSYGIEVLSPVMRTDKSRHMDEIMKVIDVFANPDARGYGAFVRDDTGLYVHVVAPKELGVLKELAFLTVIYEDEFNRMHPPRCRPRHGVVDSRLETNRTAFLRNVETKEESQTNGEEGSEEQFAQRNGAKLASVSTIRKMIGACRSETDLSKLMGDSQRHLVSWINLPCKSRIIEFRQHRSTLDKTEIRFWIQFITGLIRVADLYYRRGECPIKSWADRINAFDLMDEMELPEEGIDFYYMKIASYMNYPEDGPLNQPDWVPKPAENRRRNDKVNVDTQDPRRGTKRLRGNFGRPSPKRRKIYEGNLTSSAIVKNFDTTKITEMKVTAPPPALTTKVKKIPEDEPDGKNIEDLQNIPQQTRPSIPQQTEVSIPQQTGASIPQQTGASIPQQTEASIPQQTRVSLNDSMFKDRGYQINTTIAEGEEMLPVDNYGNTILVNQFDIADWEILHTDSSAPGMHNMCGIWALLDSLQGQASTFPGPSDNDPLREKMRNLRWSDIYQAVNNQKENVQDGKGATSYYCEEQLALGLLKIDNRLKLTIVSENAETNGRIMARRARISNDALFEPGHNVYIHHTGGNYPGEHWEAMRRKDKPASS